MELVTPSVAAGAARIDAAAWMRERLLPYWLQAVAAADGSNYEALDDSGEPLRDAPRTTLTQARLVYTWSHACLLTGQPAYLDRAHATLAFLVGHCGGAEHGWRMGPASDERDCYDHAFVLFGLAWLARASGEARHAVMAEATWGYLERALADRVHGGFRERASNTVIARRQNPHMHLLEACLAWHETTSEPRWLARADALIALMHARFIDPANGSLIEHFNADWSVAGGGAGSLREPGHHFEWVWLLAWRARLGPHEGAQALRELAQRLWSFGAQHGIDRDIAPRGLAFDELDAAGVLRNGSKLVWPQTELVKAWVARSEQTGEAQAQHNAQAVFDTLIASHFDHATVRWRNQVTRDGATLVANAPTRILYHVLLAASELARVQHAT